MLKKLFPKLFVSLLLLAIIFSGFSTCAIAQQKKIPKEPFQIVDAVTGKPIVQVLVIPVYDSFQGISTMLGEGPGNGTYSNYLDKPLIYRTGKPFILKSPKSSGLNAGFLFIGKGRTLNGVLNRRPEVFSSNSKRLMVNGRRKKVTTQADFR